MNYHNRIIQDKLERYFKAFPCVLVSGARQSGKSTLLKQLFSGKAKEFVFDPTQELYGERRDPDLFLKNNPPPLILDEIQYVPELVSSLKRYVDENRRPGMFLITGSQQWQAMKTLSESMAGRIAILELFPYSIGEGKNKTENLWFPKWLKATLSANGEAEKIILDLKSSGISPSATVWRGSYPEVNNIPSEMVPGWMKGYVSTYMQRDARLMAEIRNEQKFGSFLTLCAALTAQECNYRQIGRDIDLSTPTAIAWMNILKGTFQWIEIPAYSNNQIKKISQKPKGYFSDTGIASYLLRISSPEALSGHPSFGALFESFCVAEIIKQSQVLDIAPSFHHFRCHSGAEVDLIAEIDGMFFSVEIKLSSSVKPGDAYGISKFAEITREKFAGGIIVYAGNKSLKLNDKCYAIPFDAVSNMHLPG